MTIISLSKKFGLSESVENFLRREIAIDCVLPVKEIFSVVYNLDQEEDANSHNLETLNELIDFPDISLLDTGCLSTYEELAILYGALLRSSKKHLYSYTNHDDVTILKYGIRILTNLKGLEMARKELYTRSLTGIRRDCLVHDASTKAVALGIMSNYYIEDVLGYL